MKTLVSADEMRKCDTSAANRIEGGTQTLMGRAGAALYETYLSVLERTGKSKSDAVAVVAGGGGNGGDGYAVAELLAKGGTPCRVFTTTDKKSADGEYYFERARSAGAEFTKVDENTDLRGFGIIFDCIFGVGFHGLPQSYAAVAIDRINESGAFVISADINSGLESDSGEYMSAVRSDITVAVGIYKYGHFLGGARDLIGELTLADIGISPDGACVCAPDEDDFHDIFAKRPHNSHKGTYGTSVIIGGCREYSGAAKLANLSSSALRMGCGISRLCVPESIVNSVSPYLLESTLFPIPDRDGHMVYSPPLFDAALSKASSVALGMGWGQGKDNFKILIHMLGTRSLQVIIDADGLNAVADYGLEIFSFRRNKVTITPHPAEFSRLSGIPVKGVLENPVGCAVEFAKQTGVIVLLKGTGTVVTDGKETYIVNRGSAGMATAGSGDVLSGALAGLMSYCEMTPKTVAAAAYVCGVAGEMASDEVGDIGMTSGDTVKNIALAVKSLSAK